MKNIILKYGPKTNNKTTSMKVNMYVEKCVPWMYGLKIKQKKKFEKLDSIKQTTEKD